MQSAELPFFVLHLFYSLCFWNYYDIIYNIVDIRKQFCVVAQTTCSIAPVGNGLWPFSQTPFYEELDQNGARAPSNGALNDLPISGIS